MDITNYAAMLLYKHVTGIDDNEPVPTSFYLQVAGPTRPAITFSTPVDDGQGRMSVRNTTKIVFPAATSNWGTLLQFSIFDAQTGGNKLAEGSIFGESGQGIKINQGDTLIVDAESLEIKLTVPWSVHFQQQALNHLFRGDEYDPPDLYLGLSHAALNAHRTGGNFGELEDATGKEPGYARFHYGRGTSNWELSGSVGITAKNPWGEFGPATDDWSRDLQAVALLDAASGGNLLVYVPWTPPLTVVDDECVSVSPPGIQFGNLA